MTLYIDTSRRDVFLTDRREDASDDLTDPLRGTLQEPPELGAYLDFGTANDIFSRTRMAVDIDNLDEIRKMDVMSSVSGASPPGQARPTGSRPPEIRSGALTQKW